ncbi:hypothetical protein THRCLA_22218 [Thraustotheca clavata]|uniref:Uncharacterized protein n=1 Tax=Thraustotheca clavata TaxID=74557 RepID=A0A1V9Z9P4_9STRA|nr:hypothetical protein THRCLA_22218 [Thraustotheca clavata]
MKELKQSIENDSTGNIHSSKVGKEPISMDTYQYLAQKMLGSDSTFTRTFMIILWNLMCRSPSSLNIKHDQIKWYNDALCIEFSNMNEDEPGQQYPRHIYANPVMPWICPILALGMYWSTCQFDRSCDQLFEGSRQYERFRKELRLLLTVPEIATEMERRGVNVNYIGTNSFRKGATAFCVSGSTACPSYAAVQLRAGYPIAGVGDTNSLYEIVGDQYVGRTVCGLPINSHEFGFLPPHFIVSNSLITTALNLTFPRAPTALSFVLEFALASLVYHSDYLRQQLNSAHPLLISPLFADRDLLNQLKPLVSCTTESPKVGFRSTGIPPHVAVLMEFQSLKNTIKDQSAREEDSTQRLVTNIVSELLRSGAGNLASIDIESNISSKKPIDKQYPTARL